MRGWKPHVFKLFLNTATKQPSVPGGALGLQRQMTPCIVSMRCLGLIYHIFKKKLIVTTEQVIEKMEMQGFAFYL